MLNKTELISNLSRTANRAGLKIKKYSPEILVTVGIVSGVASAVMACKATTKLSKVLDEHKENVDQLHEYVETNGYSEEYTEEDGKKDLAIMYIQTGVKVAKLYAPAVAVGTLAITSVLSGHNIMRKRNAGLAAAYVALDKSFKDYRGRVVERFGKELDRELKYNIKSQELEETVVDEKGKEKTVKKTVGVVDPNEISDYAKFFDESCTGWSKDPEYNLLFLKKQQNWANDKLKAQGHLFLNEVYDMLGIDRTKYGNVVGWIYDEKNPNGDNFVDFGIYDIYSDRARAFVNGYERNILLDFNVDGPILDLI